MASEAPACSNPQCRVAETGKCVEGYELNECPHYGRLTVEDIEQVEESEEEGVDDEDQEDLSERRSGIVLPLGEPLDRADASALQRRRLSRAVGVIGPHLAGKTSLMAGVYEILQEGPVAGYTFAGSATLPGFELICHDARAASRRDEPHTERTTVGADATFFHLDLGKSDPSSIVSMFIADRSGEDYLAVTDELTHAAAFFELRRADVVTLLINGEHLADPELRHEIKANSPHIVDSLVEAGVLARRQRLAIVMTKKDAVAASPHSERVLAEFGEIAAAIRHRHGEVVDDVAEFVIAASPKIAGAVKRGEGVDALVDYWLRPSQSEPLPTRLEPTQSRMVDRLSFGDEVLK